MVCFDMDGLMIDSEPIWHAVVQNVFASVGVTLTLEHCLETTGLRIDELVAHHWAKHPWQSAEHTQARVGQLIIDGMVTRLSSSDLKPMPGLLHALDFFASKGVPMAVASSSPEALIEAATTGLGIKDRFVLLLSATTQELGKPVHTRVNIIRCATHPTSFANHHSEHSLAPGGVSGRRETLRRAAHALPRAGGLGRGVHLGQGRAL